MHEFLLEILTCTLGLKSSRTSLGVFLFLSSTPGSSQGAWLLLISR